MLDQSQIALQQSFWNTWNATAREHQIDTVSIEQSTTVGDWLRELGNSDLEILEVGCGAGWLCPQLTPFGRVTATDLSDEVLARAAKRHPEVTFVAGDFMTLDFEPGAYDVIVSLEVLSHVADQQAFIDRLHDLLRPGGSLILATQNRPALERNSIPPPKPGQLRRWVDRHELRALLQPRFSVDRLVSITPRFNRGVLRVINASKLRRMGEVLGLGPAFRAIKRQQERAWLGWTLMVLAQKPKPERQA